ncbi:hypothetical protein V1522DRAFT_430655 [Lipomyces starkeyi]
MSEYIGASPILAADPPAPVPGSSAPAPPPPFFTSSISGAASVEPTIAPAMPTLFAGRPRCPDQAPSHLDTTVAAPVPGATDPPIPKYKLPRYVLFRNCTGFGTQDQLHFHRLSVLMDTMVLHGAQVTVSIIQ